MNRQTVQRWYQQATGRVLDTDSACAVAGGCINDACLFREVESRDLIFVKANHASRVDMFYAEEKSLKLLGGANSIRTPTPFAAGVAEDSAFLAMEGITLASVSSREHQARLGTAIARLHQVYSPDGRFGADFPNFIGATPQRNEWMTSWADFFVRRRLEHQLDLAQRRGFVCKKRDDLFAVVHGFLDACEVRPSLLHGDLWGGNVSFDETGEPVAYDPASYFGDGEADIAFTKMFGGFGSKFYDAYRAIHPEPDDIEIRHRIYNLYHLLNHYNLFGGGYGSQADDTIRYVLSEL